MVVCVAPAAKRICPLSFPVKDLSCTGSRTVTADRFSSLVTMRHIRSRPPLIPRTEISGEAVSLNSGEGELVIALPVAGFQRIERETQRARSFRRRSVHEGAGDAVSVVPERHPVAERVHAHPPRVRRADGEQRHRGVVLEQASRPARSA